MCSIGTVWPQGLQVLYWDSLAPGTACVLLGQSVCECGNNEHRDLHCVVDYPNTMKISALDYSYYIVHMWFSLPNVF